MKCSLKYLCCVKSSGKVSGSHVVAAKEIAICVDLTHTWPTAHRHALAAYHQLHTYMCMYVCMYLYIVVQVQQQADNLSQRVSSCSRIKC